LRVSQVEEPSALRPGSEASTPVEPSAIMCWDEHRLGTSDTARTVVASTLLGTALALGLGAAAGDRKEDVTPLRIIVEQPAIHLHHGPERAPGNPILSRPVVAAVSTRAIPNANLMGIISLRLIT